MKKTYKLSDIDCANCAAKIERGIQKIDGVTAATVNFLALKLIMEIDDNADLDTILKQVVKEIHKVEPDCELI